MADSKISDLDEQTSPASGDLLPIVDDPGGSPVTKKITLANVIKLIYPVGSIFISTSSTNPGTYLGGTWSAFGAGKTLVGLDSGDGDFDTAEETGGSKTHTLTVDEMPAHKHTVNVSASGALMCYKAGESANGIAIDSRVGSTGGGSAHSIVQPYIVTYMFKRTA